MLLRRYHNTEEQTKEVEGKIEVSPQIGEEFIKDTEEAHELAMEENSIRSLETLKVDELKELAKIYEIEGYSKMKKKEIVEALRGN